MKSKIPTEIQFLKNYLNDFSSLVKPENHILQKLKKLRIFLLKLQNQGVKLLFLVMEVVQLLRVM